MWAGIGIFLLGRLLTLMSFPIFNDEGIYLQYSQLIHDDFGKYRLISAGLNPYRDWKPPFQYWFGSVFMGLPADPLLAGRLASFAVSLFGLWGMFLFVKELFGRKEASLAVLLYALLPPALFFNIQFVAETFVFSLAPWMYWCFLKAIRPDKIRWRYAPAAVVFGALVLLSKQSGMVYVFLAMLLPLSALQRSDNESAAVRKWDWKGFLIRIAVVAGGIFVALILRRLGLSSESAQMERQFNGRWLMTVPDLLRWPVAVWRTNLMSIRDYYLHYYSVFILLPVLYFFFIALRRWEPKAVLGLGFLGGSVAVLFLLKSFNEYIYNTAVIVFLAPLLAAAFFPAWEAATAPRGGKGTRAASRVAGALVLVSFAALLAHWAYQDVLMKVSPADYIRRSTPWAVGNYLEGWSGGFGVAEAVAYAKGQEGPIVVIADPQWGNPRTSMEVYAWGSQDARVISLTKDFLTAEGTQAAKAFLQKQPFKTRLAIFSSYSNDARATWQNNLESYLCDARKEIQVEPTQTPIVICSF